METNPQYYPYGETEIQALAKKDPKLGQAIKDIGMIRREVKTDLFSSLISSVVSQQISNKAYATVWSRIVTAVGDLTPKKILSIPREDLKACGLSYKKTDWIQSIAQAVDDGSFDLESLLTFSLQRPDILSYGDLAIRRGIQKLYGLDKLSKNDFERIRQRLSPYNTVASLYFWELSKTD